MNDKIFIPVVHLRIYEKLLEKSAHQGNILDHMFIREWIARMIMRNGGFSEGKYLNRSDTYQTILDMCRMGLLEKINNRKFKLIRINHIIKRLDLTNN